MEIKKNNGLAGIDIIIAVIAIMLFSTLIISMISNNLVENVKLKKENLAMIYITEIFENIGIYDYNNEAYNGLGAEYTEILEVNDLVSQDVLDEFKVEMAVITEFDGITNNDNIIKNIKLRLTYDLGEKSYTCSMERIKIKE